MALDSSVPNVIAKAGNQTIDPYTKWRFSFTYGQAAPNAGDLLLQTMASVGGLQTDVPGLIDLTTVLQAAEVTALTNLFKKIADFQLARINTGGGL